MPANYPFNLYILLLSLNALRSILDHVHRRLSVLSKFPFDLYCTIFLSIFFYQALVRFIPDHARILFSFPFSFYISLVYN
jgi:hypothetical protein